MNEQKIINLSTYSFNFYFYVYCILTDSQTDRQNIYRIDVHQGDESSQKRNRLLSLIAAEK